MVAVCVAAVLCAPARTSRDASAAPGVAAEGQSQLPTLKPSHLLDEVKRRKALRPALSAAGLARYANDLLARGGFDYDFDVCDLFPPQVPPRPGGGIRPDGTWTPITLEHRLTRADGRGVDFKIVADDRGGMCTECFMTVAALRVTKDEMTLVAGGVTYELKRPPAFNLDEAHLVDESMQKVLRTWQLPYQTIPAGVSPDGKSLYLSFYEDAGLGELVLEISDDGRPRFRAADEVSARGGEWVEEHPTDPSNDYLSFMRFRAGGRTHVIRFSGPCT